MLPGQCYVILFLLTLLTLPAQADDELRTSEPLRCPAALDDRGVKHALAGTLVFDGKADGKADALTKPGSMTELTPDKGQWNLEDYRPSVTSFYLICHFENTESTLMIPIPPGMRLCEQDGNNAVCR